MAIASLLPACIIHLDGEDGGGASAGDDFDPGFDDGTGGDIPGDDEGGSTEGGTTDDEGTTGVEPEGECLDNPILDPGFEDGTPSSSWEEASDLFGTPLCDASCTEDEGAGPHSGAWWVWFGGVEQPEAASVEQDVVIPVADSTHLRFHLWINAAAGTGDDVFTMMVDDTVVFMATDAEIDDYGEYTRVDVDISEHADGEVHRLRFHGSKVGTGLTSFFLDDVDLISCDAPATGESSGDFDETGGTDDTDGDPDTDADGDASGSDTDGGSTG